MRTLDGKPSQEFKRVTKEIAIIINANPRLLSKGNRTVARMIVSNLAHTQGYTPKMFVGKLVWTTNSTSMHSDSSDLYERAVNVTVRVLNGRDAHASLKDQALPLACRIMEALAHDPGLIPPSQ